MLLALGLCQSLAAQQCYEEVATSDDTDRFVINIDGTVSDTKTGLMWQRCKLHLKAHLMTPRQIITTGKCRVLKS